MHRCLFAVLVLVAGCRDLRADGDPDAGPAPDVPAVDGSIPSASGAFTHEVGADGTITTRVNATDLALSVYLDLETGLATDEAGPWDVAFRRYYVTTNGGVSGDDGGAAARVPGTTFDALTRAPMTGWREDLPDADDDLDNGPDTAFNGGVEGIDDWYDYEPGSHRLSARDVVFAVRSGAGRFFAVQMLGYYDAVGTPAWPSFRWKPIEAATIEIPDAGPITPRDAGVDGGMPVVIPPDAIEIDASDREAWIYFDVESSAIVDVAEPSASRVWDLAFRRAAIRTNSGSSGPGLGGARSTDESEPGEVETTGTLGFALDELETETMPGTPPTSTSPVVGDWFLYDFMTHTVTPRATVYVVRTGDGGYGRLRVWAWVDGVYTVSIAPIERLVETASIEVDASSTTAWAYLDLAQGLAVTDVTAPTIDARWDLALQRTAIATSSGTSGPGMGGALDGAADFASVTGVPVSGFAIDEALPLPGPPGSGTYSGNPALAGWYDYDDVTHVVSPRATTFLVRLRDGSAGKLAIRSWDAGRFVFDWAYAGPGRDHF